MAVILTCDRGGSVTETKTPLALSKQERDAERERLDAAPEVALFEVSPIKLIERDTWGLHRDAERERLRFLERAALLKTNAR